MITKEVISAIYKKYPKRAKSIDCLDFAFLFDAAGLMHDINIDMETNKLIIGSIDPKSIFHSIPLNHIHAFVPFDEWVAIVLHSSIIFLNRKSPKSSIHLKPIEAGLTDRLREMFSSAKAIAL